MKANAGVKLAIRTDEKAGVIRAYFSKMDDSERFEVATLDLELARTCDGLFDRWKDALAGALKASVEKATGLEVTGFETFRPHDKN